MINAINLTNRTGSVTLGGTLMGFLLSVKSIELRNNNESAKICMTKTPIPAQKDIVLTRETARKVNVSRGDSYTPY